MTPIASSLRALLFHTAALAALASFVTAGSMTQGPDSPVKGATSSPAGQRVLRPSSIPDKAMGIERSHTLLAPEGWEVRGGAVWTPGETVIQHMDLDLSGPDGIGVSLLRSGTATLIDSNLPGDQSGFAKTRLRANSTPADVAVHEILKRKRPGARRIRVIESSTVKPMLSVYEGLSGATAKQLERQGSLSMGGEQRSTKVELDVPKVRVSYRLDGESWEEEILFYMMKVDTSTQSSFGGWYRMVVWHFTSPVSVRAKKGELDAELGFLYTVLGSVSPTQEWVQKRHVMNVVVAQARHRASMASLEALRRSAEQVARSDSRIREASAASWRQQQAAGDASQRALVDAFAGVEQYRLPDGSTMALDAGYKRAYADGNGAILLTDDLLTDPNVGSSVEWSRIQVVRRR